MTIKNYITVGMLSAVLLAGAVGVVSAVYVANTPMPLVLQVGASGNVLLRGTVSAVGANSLTVKSWGGDWVVNISSSARLMPSQTMTQFSVGDFVGVQGMVNQNTSFAVDATLVRNWTPNHVVSNPAPVISYLQPNSGVVGASVTIYGSNFTAIGNKIIFGNLGSENNPAYNLNSSNGTAITFTVPSSNYLSCWYSNPACMAPVYQTQPGNYNVSVMNSNGTSNQVTFTVISTCTPNWQCGWGPCSPNGYQSMTAVDTNHCPQPTTPSNIMCPMIAQVCPI